MTARDVLLLMITAFFFTALLLIHNGFYRPLSTGAVEPTVQADIGARPYARPY